MTCKIKHYFGENKNTVSFKISKPILKLFKKPIVSLHVFQLVPRSLHRRTSIEVVNPRTGYGKQERRMGSDDKLGIHSCQQFDMLGQLLLKSRSHGVLRLIKQIERLVKKMFFEIRCFPTPIGLVGRLCIDSGGHNPPPSPTRDPSVLFHTTSYLFHNLSTHYQKGRPS